MKELFAERLKSARRLSAMSLRALSDKLDGIVSHQAIAKYEKAEMMPDSTKLIAIADALEVNVEYFFRTPKVKIGDVKFRKKSTMSKRKIQSIKTSVADYLDKYLEIETILNIENNFTNPLENNLINNIKDLEKAADELRKKWNLGFGPVPNILKMLEDRGIKIVEIDSSDKIDGFADFAGGIPFIVINKNNDIVRKRFTVMHELGHLLLNFGENVSPKEEEAFCNTFSAAFLLPISYIRSEHFNKKQKIGMSRLVSVKEYFGISVQAIFMRFYSLGIVDDRRKFDFFRYIRGNHLQNENTLGEYKGAENSDRFRDLVFKSVIEEEITTSKGAELVDESLDIFREQLRI